MDFMTMRCGLTATSAASYNRGGPDILHIAYSERLTVLSPRLHGATQRDSLIGFIMDSQPDRKTPALPRMALIRLMEQLHPRRSLRSHATRMQDGSYPRKTNGIRRRTINLRRKAA